MSVSTSVRVASFIAAVTGLMVSLSANAACSATSTYRTINVNIDMGRVMVDPALPVGQTIKEIPITAQGIGATISGGPLFCDQAGAYLEYAATTNQVSGLPGVYATRVQGVGIRFHVTPFDGAASQVIGTTAGQLFYSRIGLGSSGRPTPEFYGHWGIENVVGRVELVKTASAIGSGPLGTGRVASLGAAAMGAAGPLHSFNLSSNSVIAAPTCRVEAGSRNMVVGLPTVSTSVFQSIGSAAAPRDFQIRLACQAEAGAGVATVGLRMDAISAVPGVDGIIALNNVRGSARGVSIILTRPVTGGEVRVKFGEAIPLGYSIPGVSLLYSVPLRARYIQIAPQVVAGEVNSTASFTIQYN